MVELISTSGFAAVLFAGLIALAVHEDVASLRIPNTICMAIAALFPCYAVAAALPLQAVLTATGTAVAVFVVGTLLFSVRLIGGGDVKLIAAISLWAGPAGILPFLVTTTLAGGAIAMLMIGSRRFVVAHALGVLGADDLRARLLGHHIPYALAIGAGAALTVVPTLLGRAAG